MNRILWVLFFALWSTPLLPFTKHITDYLVQGFGTQPLSKKHQRLVKSLMHKMNISKPIDMRLANWQTKALWGRNNALAMYDHYLFISDSFFNELSKKEQRFLIGHELSHIKFNHNSKQLSVLILLIMLVFFVYKHIYAFLRTRISRRIIRIPIGLFCFWALLVGRQVIYATLSRVCERQADKESALCLHCPEGGIAFFNRLEKTAQFPQKKNRLQKALSPWVATHPSNKERIECLKDFKINKDQK
ncbi:MAG: M48 family metalloprotease [Candidatus Babeliales bacterium]